MKRKVIITRIIDGDTYCFMDKTIERKIRIRRIDCPETRLNRENQIDEYHKSIGIKVKDTVNRLLLNKKVTLIIDKNIVNDIYGRILADVIYKKTNLADFLLEHYLAKKCIFKREEWSREELENIENMNVDIIEKKFNDQNRYICFCV